MRYAGAVTFTLISFLVIVLVSKSVITGENAQ